LIIIAILSQSCSASSILCVVSRILDSFNCLTILNKLRRETGSTPVVGSSKNSIYGETSNVSAQESFRLFPPDRLPALTCINSSKSNVWTMRLRLFRNYLFVRPFILAMNYKFSLTVSCSQIGLYWGHIPIRRPSTERSIF
jgi:hypothetical protein